MKIVRFEHGRESRYGVLDGEIIRVLSAEPWNSIATTEALLPATDQIRWLAPCVPSKVVAVAMNYPGVSGSKSELVEPLTFIKSTNSVASCGDLVINPFPDSRMWGEVELAIVIGRTLKRVNEQDAKQGIFGFTVANDFTVENVEGRDHHLARAKSADGFCVLGPWIDTEFIPEQQKISGYQNERLLRQGFLGDRIWKDARLVSWISQWMTLIPGDVVLTGCPSRIRGREYLKEGDTFRCVIEDLGEMTCHIGGFYG